MGVIVSFGIEGRLLELLSCNLDVYVYKGKYMCVRAHLLDVWCFLSLKKQSNINNFESLMKK